ncbi:TATA box-binding protein-associated factor, RNA polymerase I, subunit C [Oryzias melastigma]|uniref:TATA box-binding protein-associated factor, RNA polymerase I, subunit C n=1 Tax=Oryzias melastigma TaxID=30732 RepID=A0A834C530_ORYME|nr:TATA box-binding protein-associated factor, RNA polymerase I, subunit C [Oryzias melastigma]
MDHQFPAQLFPSFYNHGPPDLRQKHGAGGWGSYELVIPQEGAGPGSSWTFTSRHQVSGETWLHGEPVPIPLLSPRRAFLPPETPPGPTDFTEHMQNFYTDHSQDAFGCMSHILGENFNFTEKRGKTGHRCDSINMSKMKRFLDQLKFRVCQRSYHNRTVTRYCSLLSDVVHDIPPQLLGSLLHEELEGQRDRMLFSEANIGGALAFVPFSPSQSHGCLLYPGGRGLDRLNFHGVALQYQQESDVCVDASSRKPLSFQLKAPIRQISCTSLFSDCCAAVRSDHLCGVWRFSERNEPRLLQVINTSELSTCINVSPHVLGEVLVASESGAADLWTVGRGFQKVRVEDSNLYFNAKSPWRWCEFSAHPRVMLYADRTGAELTDMRVSPSSSNTLFRISSTSECHRGERLILSKYLGDVHSFHHLITTQYSAYILDERFPCVPMLNSQETVLLQYSGGRAEASVSRGPPQALLRPRDSLKHLPVQIPHRLRTTSSRLSAPAAGLTCIISKAGGGPEEHMCVLQLTEAGDVFCQTLELQLQGCSTSAERSPTEAASTPPRRPTAAQPPAAPLVSDSCSDEDICEPTQATSSQTAVPETPEGKQGSKKQFSDSSSECSEYESRRRKLKRMQLQVFFNDEPEMNEERAADADGAEGEEEHHSEEADETSSCTPAQQQNPAELSSRTLMTWKLWLQKLRQRSCEEKPRPQWYKHLTTNTRGLLCLPQSGSREPAEKERVESLQQKLLSCMHERSLLLHSPVSEDLRVPVPELVNTDDWTDPLSQRLTLSWQGESAWKAWWEEELGLNRDAKMQSLRRKRRRQKEARRAAGQQWELSHSFTSSCSSQSQLDDFSDSSMPSQRQWSDSEGAGVLSRLAKRIQDENQGGIFDADAPGPTPSATPKRPKDTQSELQVPDQSQTPSLSQTRSYEVTAAGQRRKRPTQDHLNALFPAQDHPSETETAGHERPSSSQLRSLPASLGSTRPVPSRSPFSPMASSQLLSPSRGSQRQLRLSQSSQPKKKRPQMGF